MECKSRLEANVEIGPLRKRWSMVEVGELPRTKDFFWRVDDWKLERPQVEKSLNI